jgi:hypothetical protein
MLIFKNLTETTIVWNSTDWILREPSFRLVIYDNDPILNPDGIMTGVYWPGLNDSAIWYYPVFPGPGPQISSTTSFTTTTKITSIPLTSSISPSTSSATTTSLGCSGYPVPQSDSIVIGIILSAAILVIIGITLFVVSKR